MSKLLERLRDPVRSGVYRVTASDAIEQAAPAAARIDLKDGDALRAISRALQFPDWFGGNWDAWFDCLTDLGWHAPAPGYVLVVRRALGMHRTAPETLDTALAIIEDAARVWADRGVTLRAFVDLEA